MSKVNVDSEIGKLRGVIIHTPGREVENMTPENAQRALYSDILNLSVAQTEYSQFKGVLQKFSKTYEVRELLKQTLEVEGVKETLFSKICKSERSEALLPELFALDSAEAARQLIEGVELKRDNLTRFLSNERYELRPMHNFFFTRDASVTVFDRVLISSMASKVRERETLIMKTIFKYHPEFKVKTVSAGDFADSNDHLNFSIEGGDVLVARKDVLIIGSGTRTSTQGIDFIIEEIKKQKGETFHILVQELPETPESFIHLDMVFTFLDRDKCMVYKPLFNKHNRFRTIHIEINNGEVVKISYESDLLYSLKNLGFNLEPLSCGGTVDSWNQEREQWHSGANFFALAPGIVIGYERNSHTIDEFSKVGFDVIKAADIISEKISIEKISKAVITIAGSELARGGGGARCMSMPVLRDAVEW